MMGDNEKNNPTPNHGMYNLNSDIIADVVKQEYENIGRSRNFLINLLEFEPRLAQYFVNDIIEHLKHPSRNYLDGKKSAKRFRDAAIYEFYIYGPLGKRYFFLPDGSFNEEQKDALEKWQSQDSDEKIFQISRYYKGISASNIHTIVSRNKKLKTF